MQDTQRQGYRSPHSSIRWLNVRNMTGETIPGWGLIYLPEIDNKQAEDKVDYFNSEASDNQVVFHGYKPDEDAQHAQNPAMFLINGPTPIPPKAIGKATADFPAQVLHDGGLDGLPNGHKCGPIADSWYVWSTGSAFTAIGHDSTYAAGVGAIHTVWISNVPQRTVEAWYGTTSVVAVTNGYPLTLQTVGTQGDKFTLDDSLSQELTTDFDGLVLWSFSATLTSDTGTEGAMLRLRLYKTDKDDNRTATHLQGYRNLTIEDDQGYQDPFRTSENVAFSSVFPCARGDRWTIENDSGTDMLVTAAVVSAVSLMRLADVPGGDGFNLNKP